jgi:hypothetical protein
LRISSVITKRRRVNEIAPNLGRLAWARMGYAVLFSLSSYYFYIISASECNWWYCNTTKWCSKMIAHGSRAILDRKITELPLSQFRTSKKHFPNRPL